MNITTTYPLEMVCFDFLTLEQSKGGYGNLLVITDHFTKFAVVVPTKNQTAKTTADAFFNNFIVNFGIPSRLHSDQGANFESAIIKELCNIMGIRKTHTTPYHPQGNAGPERMNRTLLSMLGTLDNAQKGDWKAFINPLVHAYSCTPHESTGISPYELLFGRKPRLPIDVKFDKAFANNYSKSTKEYLEELQERIVLSQEIASKHTQKAQERQKSYYDRKAKAVTLEIGDRVLVRRLAFDGKHKISDKFEEEIFIVTEQSRADIPVYKVEGETTGLMKTIHRNHLMPIGHMNRNDGQEDEVVKVSHDKAESLAKDVAVVKEKPMDVEGAS